MAKKYIVTLSAKECETLLKLDEGWQDQAIWSPS